MLVSFRRVLIVALALALVAQAPPSGASPAHVTVPAGSAQASGVQRGGLGRHRVRPALCSGMGKGAFIGANNSNIAGGDFSGILAGQFNQSCGESTGVMVGFSNETDDMNSFIGAGAFNTTGGSFDNAIAAGENDENDGINSLIGAGQKNKITSKCTASGNGCSVAGGDSTAIVAGVGNTINGARLNSANGSIIGAGQQNGLSGQWAGIFAGSGNSITGDEGFIGAGSANSVTGKDGAIPGGSGNTASGNGSFAAGREAQALNDGAFVWSDTSSGPLVQSTTNNQFVARASGGVTFYSSNNLSTGVTLAKGSGSWSSVGGHAVERGISAVDPSAILAKVVALPVAAWSYASQDPGIRHMGPTAEDFHAAFGVGEDDRHIATVDEGGVALAAIKGLHAENTLLRARLARQAGEIAALRDEVARIAAKVDARR